MTFTRLLSLGMGAILALFVAFAVMVGVKTQSITDSISVISLQHNVARRSSTELEILLLKVREDFHFFEQRGRVYPEDFNQLLSEFKSRLAALPLTDPRATRSIEITNQSLDLSQQAWAGFILSGGSRTLKQGAPDNRLNAVRSGLTTARSEMRKIGQLSTLGLPREELKIASNILTLADIELERYINLGSITLDPVMQSIEQIQSLLTSLAALNDTPEFKTVHAQASEATQRFRHTILIINDDDRVGMTSTSDESISQAKENHRLMHENVQKLQGIIARSLEARYASVLSEAAEANDLTRLLLIGCVFACLLLVLLLRRHLHRRISELTDGVLMLSRGEFGKRIPIHGNDEMAVISKTFNQMVDALETKEAERKQHVEEIKEGRRAAENASRAKSEFLANMSHEIRTPINGVLGMTEVLLKTELDEKQRRFAKTVYRSGEGLLRVINDILDFSRIEAGKLELQSVPFNLRDLIEDIGELFAESAHSKGLELVCALHPDFPTQYNGDAGRIRQILTNLVGNAIKFTEDGEVVVKLISIESNEDDHLVRFEVKDTGIGIPQEAQASIFKSFTQADGATNRQYGGSGLGLTICSQIVSLMGGEIGVQSAPGLGSLFWFQISIARDKSAIPVDASRGALAGSRVLIVDDNPTNREILELQMESWNVESESTASGAEALTALRRAAAANSPFDLAVLDMHMPGMDGLMLSKSINEDSEIAPVRRVMLSSICDYLNARDYREAGISAYMVKPARQSELYNCLVGVMQHSTGGGDLESQPAGEDSPGKIAFEGRLLLAEDNLVNQEVAYALIAPFGLSIDVVEDGRAAIDAWGKNNYDLIFMDCQMPVMDGYDATRQIRQMEAAQQRSRTTIIALTANALQGDREQCIEAGMDDYLSKPYSEWQLVEVLRRWLSEVEPQSIKEMEITASLHPTSQDSVDSTTAHEEVLDPSALEKFRHRERNGRKNVLARIVGAYLEQSSQHVTQLVDAARGGDASAVQFAAHTLKSSSASIGAFKFAELCKQLEECARSQKIDDIEAQLQALQAMYQKVCNALDQSRGQDAA